MASSGVHRRLGWAVVALAVLLAGSVAAAPAAPAAPSSPLVVLKCQFSDNTAHNVAGSPINDDPRIADFLVNRGTDGLVDYFTQLSDGTINFAGAPITGWYTMPTKLVDDPGISRDQRIQDCIDTAQRAGWSRPAGSYLLVFRNQCTDHGRGNIVPRSALLDPCSTLRSAAVDLAPMFWPSIRVAYDDDPWSLFSSTTVFQQFGPRWGPRPVGMDAFRRYQASLMDPGRLFYWPDRTNSQRAIAPVYGAPSGSALPQMIYVYGSVGSQYPVYLIEYRYPSGLDTPIRSPIVLIHGMTYGLARLIRAADGSPSQHLVAGAISIDVVSSGGPTATVQVNTNYRVPVPDLVGATPADAATTLQGLGLTVAAVSPVELTCKNIGVVSRQVPAAWTLVVPGSPVTLTTGVAPPGGCP